MGFHLTFADLARRQRFWPCTTPTAKAGPGTEVKVLHISLPTSKWDLQICRIRIQACPHTSMPTCRHASKSRRAPNISRINSSLSQAPSRIFRGQKRLPCHASSTILLAPKVDQGNLFLVDSMLVNLYCHQTFGETLCLRIW